MSSINDDIKKGSYFQNRNIGNTTYDDYKMPRFLNPYFEQKDKDLAILDIGCGLGQMLTHLKNSGFNNLFGIDINDESIIFCKQKNLDVAQVDDIREFALNSERKFDRIIMSHVLEHIDKEVIIDTLIHIKKYLLNEGGIFLLMVPNAQSYTGAYWRYEDFTHNVMFTAGSCIYVLRSAGFTEIEFIDPDGTKHMSILKKIIIKSLIRLHKLKENFWNKVLQTSFHKVSPRIYTFELKVAAK